MRRIPPQNLEAEQAVLGGIFLRTAVFHEVLDVLVEDDFYSPAHRAIYSACRSLFEKGAPIDLVTVAEELTGLGQLETVGGPVYLAELAASPVSASNALYHAKIVKDKGVQRKLIETAGQIIASSFEAGGSVDTLLDESEQAIFRISESRTKNTYMGSKELVSKVFRQLEELYAKKELVTGVPTGYHRLDEITAGLQPSDLIIIAGRPSMGKCCAADTEVALGDGGVRTIEQICRAGVGEVLTLGDDWKFAPARPSAFVDDGVKPVYRLTTKLGRRVDTTLSHPYLTLGGWRPLAEIAPGQHIAVPRVLGVFGNRDFPECQVKILAYLLGDGNMTGTAVRFTNADARLRREFIRSVEAMGGLVASEVRYADRTPEVRVSADLEAVGGQRQGFGAHIRRELARRDMTQRDLALAVGVSPASVSHWVAGRCAPDPATCARVAGLLPGDGAPGECWPVVSKNSGNALVRWLRTLGLMGADAHAKFIPDEVFTLPRRQAALFLNRLFATDGWACVYKNGQAHVGYASVSERLARQVQHLLLRFGILAKLRARKIKYPSGERPAWQLDVTGGASLRTFCEEIGIFGKEPAVEEVVRRLAGRRTHTNTDVLPREAWTLLDQARKGESWSRLARRAGLRGVSNIHVGKRGLSRQRFLKLALALGDANLVRLGRSDVYWDEVVSVGYLGQGQVYDLTIPQTHNFVANDVCVHNTAFALNLALRAATHFDVPSAVFSLEMSMDQLMMRMLCIRAKVDLGSLRRGFISDADWSRLFDAAQDLSQAPIFIDDTPALSSLELRARCRRLKAEKKLGLVVVDYLQLMRASRVIDSREQEISEISRSLKALAKEIHVPVIALSQLNRKVEERTDKRPKLSDLRECVTGDTLAVLADGSRVQVASLVGSRPTVLCLDREGKMTRAECDRVWSTGVRPVYLMRTRDGHEIRATSGHRFLSGEGWKKVEHLAPGDRLARVRFLPEPAAPVMWSEARVALLAHLLGDGSYLKGKSVKYTSSTRAHLDVVAEASRAEFGTVVREYDYKLGWRQLTLTGGGNRWHPSALRRWLAELGIFDQRSHEKRVPAALFSLSNAQVGLFLRHLWSTDGCIHYRKEGGRGPRCSIYYSTTSRGLAGDVAALLLRLGILARIGSTRKKDYRPSFQVHVYGIKQQALFLDRVGAFGAKVPDAEKARNHLTAGASNPNVDTLPRELWTRARAVMREKGITQRQMAALRGASYGGTSHYRFAPSRKMLMQYADLLDDALLRQAAQSDIFWDEVKSVEPAGTEEVYDLTVPGPANWLADGLVSHNSGAIEQDADVIMFLYRDAVYNKQEDNPKANIAEVIIGKQRNGPIGEVDLVFLKESTSFEDMEHSPAPSEYSGS